MIEKITFQNIAERKIFAILFTGVIFCLSLYIFFIGVMSVSATQMGVLESDVRILSSYIGELESEYLALGKDVTLSYAYSLGFEEPKEIAFVTSKTFAVNVGQ